jgi:hypothetical protein
MKPSLESALFNSSACRYVYFCIGIKLNVSCVTDCNDQKGMKTQFLSGPQAALSNHSGTSKRPDGEFTKLYESYCFYSLELCSPGESVSFQLVKFPLLYQPDCSLPSLHWPQS